MFGIQFIREPAEDCGGPGAPAARREKIEDVVAGWQPAVPGVEPLERSPGGSPGKD